MARDITVSFGGVTALRGVGLTLRRGQILGVIGPNGAGKSTLTNILTGVISPSQGSVWLGERELTRLPTHLIYRAGVARTFQGMRLFDDMTAFENIEVAASGGLPRSAARTAAAALLEEFSLARYGEELTADLPYGVQKMVALARALAGQPQFLLLDEPAAGLNDVETEHLLTSLRRIRDERNVGIMLIDHDLPLIMGACDTVLAIANGEKIAEGTPSAVRSDPAVIKAYIGG